MAKQPAESMFQRLFNRRTWIVTCVSIIVYVVIAESDEFYGQLLPIKSIEITSKFQGMQPGNLQQAIASHVKTGFFGVDVNAVKQAAEQLPWAGTVSVRRVWPDRIQLEVAEQLAIARWGDSAVINDDGELFYPGPEDMPTDLVQLRGPEGTHTLLLSHLRELQMELAEHDLRVSSLVYNRRRAIEVGLDNGIQLLIGRVRNVRESTALITRFAQAYDQTLVNRADKISSVDLRYTNGFSVQWKGVDVSVAGKAGTIKNINLKNVSRGSVNG